MRALLDEHLPVELAELLRSRGLDVVAVLERAELVERSDQRLIEAATADGRAIVTANVKDFRPLAARRLATGEGHAGLILLPPRRRRTRDVLGRLADGVERIMRDNPNGLDGSERWVPPDS